MGCVRSKQSEKLKGLKSKPTILPSPPTPTVVDKIPTTEAPAAQYVWVDLQREDMDKICNVFRVRRYYASG